jgi:hypothetical protein
MRIASEGTDIKQLGAGPDRKWPLPDPFALPIAQPSAPVDPVPKGMSATVTDLEGHRDSAAKMTKAEQLQ